MNNKYMQEAFKEAIKAYKEGEVPIGAVIVKDNNIIAKAHNKKEKNKCCLYHAELLAIMKASNKLNNWRLDGCDIYITLDPCPMCASAIKQARINNIYSALGNTDTSYNELIRKILENDATNPEVKMITDLDSEKAKHILNEFFKERR